MAVSVADLLVQRLRQHGVRHIFGYPGGQLTPLYDALVRQSEIRHILARHEQAAAFMADGYARATGRPGVCLAVCGPGVLNAATGLATAFTDSVPVLCISGQVKSDAKGLRSGYYHENEQAKACASFTKVQLRVDEAAAVPYAVDRAFNEMTRGRPGPALLEIPLDVLRTLVDGGAVPQTISILVPIAPAASRVAALAELVARWERPLLLAGGGVTSAGAFEPLRQVAERLGAPVLHTLMGKCAIGSDHPLAAGLTWQRATSDVSNMQDSFSPLCAQADGVLAVGCRFSQASTGSWQLPLPKALAQIDIDPAELGRHYPLAMGIHADAALTLIELLKILPEAPRQPWAKLPIVRQPWRLPGIDLVGPLRRVLPRDACVVADVTRLGYILLAEFPVYAPRSFLHPAGFVAMGYGIPAALGVKAAFPDRAVVAVEGDGCFQMCGMELASAVQEKLPIVIVLVNDSCLTLIKSTQERRYDRRFIAVDLVNPDFGKLADAFGVRYWQATDDAGFEKALAEAIGADEAALIEVTL